MEEEAETRLERQSAEGLYASGTGWIIPEGVPVRYLIGSSLLVAMQARKPPAEISAATSRTVLASKRARMCWSLSPIKIDSHQDQSPEKQLLLKNHV